MPRLVSDPTSAEAAAPTVPSPPPTISSASPRSATARQRTEHSPPSISSMSGSTPARSSATRTFSPVSGSAATVPPPRLSRTGTRTIGGLLAGRRGDVGLGGVRSAFADALRFRSQLHRHLALRPALDMHIDVRGVGVGRISTGHGHVHHLSISLPLAAHGGVELPAAHGEMVVTAIAAVLAGEHLAGRVLGLLR